MSKKLNNMKWESVALDGFPVSMADKGFMGLEECTDYNFDKEKKRSKKTKLKEKKEQKKPKNNKRKAEPSKDEPKEVPSKKVKLSNGFVVESCETVSPTLGNNVKTNSKKNANKTEEGAKKSKNKRNKKKKGDTNTEETTDNKPVKKSKQKLGDLPQSTSELTAEDMLTWAEFKLQEPILRALTELGFKQPTKIQQLTLPAAIHGRRDILGAAETGSGKTLAFGLPILSGILKLKEKALQKGLDVYDIPYKKPSNKKKDEPAPKGKKDKFKKKDKKKPEKKEKVEEVKVKESSEDGYSSGEESNNDGDEPKKEYNDDDYLEEIVVPYKKKENSADEGNDSDDSDNYIHLSDMLDSDDLAETSDENDEGDEESGAEAGSGDEGSDAEAGSGEDDIDEDDLGLEEIDGDAGSDVSGEADDEELDDQGDEDEVDENEQGIGCVKVLDNIEIPGHVSMKTGKPLYALIITPTRELAIQISRHLVAVAKYTGIKVATIVGGMAAVKQERVLRSGPEVVVATPGRLWELVGQGQPHLQQLDTVKFLAIDETDRMIERGHFEELQPLLERLNADEERSAARQNFVFSATLTMVHDLPTHMKGKKVTQRGKIINRKIEKMTPQQKVNRLIKMLGMTEPKVVDITTQNLGTAETLTESRITCAMEHKDAYLYYIVKRHPGRTIVFCNSIGSVKRLAQLFTLLKCRPLPLHASMPQRQRLKNLERFRDDPHGILIATDVAARGLDIPCVEHVVHYQVPRTAENYVHRSGRTARASREGLTILMMEPAEAYLYSKMCRTLNKNKGENIWDHLVHTRPKLVAGGGDGDVACDSYHQWRRDIQMCEELGLDIYRFSISWSRLLPSGYPNIISEDGKNYYNNLIDGLLEKGIEPVVTVHHFDLPQSLQDLGGWANPLIVDWFTDYAEVVFSLFGDRVTYWVTINEPFILCEASYSQFLAPYYDDPDIGRYLCNKNVLVAHAKAYRMYDELFRSRFNGKLSLSTLFFWFEPATPEDQELTDLMFEFWEGRYAYPVYSKVGGWPVKLEKFLAEKARREGYSHPRLPPFTPEEIDMVRGTYDYYALNHYTTRLVRRLRPGEENPMWPLIGSPEMGIVMESHPSWVSVSNWFAIWPQGFRKQLNWLNTTYDLKEIFITENGIPLGPDMDDTLRVEYYRSYLGEILQALHEGVPITGYTAWTLMDNFEWMTGYTVQFGLYSVNFTDPMRTRTPRTSAKYYANVTRTRMLYLQNQEIY